MSDCTLSSVLRLSLVGPLTASAFAAAEGISYQAASSRLTILTEKGLASRRVASTKTRLGSKGRFAKFVYSLTPKGTRMAEAAASLT